MRELGLFVAGAWQQGDGVLTVRSPYDGHEVARVARAGNAHLAAALEAAATARPALATRATSRPS